MKNVSRLLPLLPGIALLTGCNQKVQKDNGQNSQKPNIIYIFADDLGIGDLSCYGATKVSTPHIDRLAGQGVQFTNAYATSATSTPSRFGLLTGMYPWRQENTGIAPGNSELIIDTACVTMADMLKEAGYATGVVFRYPSRRVPAQSAVLRLCAFPSVSGIWSRPAGAVRRAGTDGGTGWTGAAVL